jgi:hypothetical protein
MFYSCDVQHLFRLLFGLGTVMVVFGVLFAQTKGTDHTPDLVVWLIAVTLLLAALFLGWLKPQRAGRPAVGWLVAIAIELLLCAAFIADVLQHLHSL